MPAFLKAIAVFVVMAMLPVTAVAQTPAAAGIANAYRINAGDEVEIYVWGEERLQRIVRVLPDGTFAFPLVGRINAAGMLPQQVEQTISTGLRDQYRGQVPQVTVSIKTPAGMQFSVIGRVKTPGTFTPGRYVNVLEALSMAGGPAEFANLNEVTIVRKQGNNLIPLRARLGAVLRPGVSAGTLNDANIVRLETGDTVIVP